MSAVVVMGKLVDYDPTLSVNLKLAVLLERPMHHGDMTPDASSVVAQVDAALMIALTVDARFQKENVKKKNKALANDNEGAPRSYAWLYLVALFGLVISILITLESVFYDKSVTGFTAQIILLSTAIGFLPLLFSAGDRIVPVIENSRVRILIFAAIIIIYIYIAIWNFTFAPNHGF